VPIVIIVFPQPYGLAVLLEPRCPQAFAAMLRIKRRPAHEFFFAEVVPPKRFFLSEQSTGYGSHNFGFAPSDPTGNARFWQV